MQNINYFKAFLAVNPKQIREKAIISPILYPKHFAGNAKIKKSSLGYLVADYGKFTLIKTPMTQAAVADAMALLPETKCKEVIFVGAAGGLGKGLKIGDVLMTDKAKHVYSFNSLREETREKLSALRKKGVLGIDFESCGFFAAARNAKLKATAYYVITDLPLSKPFYLKKTEKEKNKIKDAIGQIILSVW